MTRPACASSSPRAASRTWRRWRRRRAVPLGRPPPLPLLFRAGPACRRRACATRSPTRSRTSAPTCSASSRCSRRRLPLRPRPPPLSRPSLPLPPPSLRPCAPSAAGSARLAPRAAHLRLLLLRLRSKHEAALLRVGPRQQELARNPHGTFLQAALLRVGPRRRAQLAVRRHQARKRGQPNPNPSPTPTRCTPPPSAQTRLARPTRLRPSRRLREPEPSRRLTGARPGCRRSPTSTTGCTGCA